MKHQMLSCVGVFLLAGAVQAATVNEVDFVESRTRSVSAGYTKIPRDGGPRIEVLGDQEAGASADVLNARIDTSVADLRDVGVGASGGIVKADAFGPVSNIFLSGQVNNSTDDSFHLLSGRITETLVGRLTASVPAELRYSFALTDIFFEVWDNTFDGALDEIPMDGQIRYTVDLNGERAYSLTETFRGDRLGSLVTTGGVDALDPDVQHPFFIDDNGTGPGDVPRLITMNDIFETDILLGTLSGAAGGAGQLFEVTVSMEADLFLPPFELDAGARLNFGDPNGLSGAFGRFTLETGDEPGPGVIPLPPSMALLLGGLGLFGFVRRRRGGWQGC